jgi:hypothetical protein
MTKKNDVPPDYVIYGPPDEDGNQQCLRHTNGQIENGQLRPFDGFENAPDGAEVLRIKSVAPSLGIITESYKPGPAMVSSDAYRDGWDNIFGRKEVGQA